VRRLAGASGGESLMLSNVDLIVLIAYLASVVGLGLWLGRKKPSTNEFMAAGRSLPGWAIGLSMFGSYISSLSFLANPGKSYATDWNAFAFTIATPIAAAIGVRWFVPFYRNTGEVSAYEHLEHRF
jgi:SSS family solute:Na+ symporter